MKATIAFLLSLQLFAGSLFPQTDVEEVYKIPWLFKHYQEHKRQAAPDFSFWDFLLLHYHPASAHAKAPHPDVKIPLYNHLMTGMIFVVSQTYHHLAYVEFTLPSGIKSFYQVTYAYQFSLSLLRPPR